MMNTTAPSSSGRSAPERQRHPSPQRSRVGRVATWFALLGAALAWSLQELINVSLAGHACYPHDLPLAAPLWPDLVVIAAWVEAAAILICIAAGVVGFLNWRRSRGEKPGGAHEVLGGGDGRTRFLAMSSMLTSGLFLVATVFATLYLAVVTPCGG